MDQAAGVVDALKKFGDGGSLILSLTLIGSLTMAMIQVVKDMAPVLRMFQRRYIAHWIGRQSDKFNQGQASAVLPKPIVDQAKTKATLVDLATGGAQEAFYDLPVDQLVAQMNAAAQLALDYPMRYYDLLAVLAAGTAADDFSLVAGVDSARNAVAATGLPPGYADARTRLSHRMQRNLDGLQIAMGDRWQWWLQLLAMLLSIAVTEIAVWANSTSQDITGDLMAGAGLGVIGGYMAPVTRDLVAALQSLRK